MNNKKIKFKSAFTLMEIGISLLIMSILIILCIPIVTNQMKKTDEYAYYAAFKTVEKMGSQIVAFGDPEGLDVDDEEDESGAFNINTSPFTLKDYIADYANTLVKSIFPKAYAAIQTSVIVSFPSYEYDYVRVCLGNKNVQKDFDVHAGNTWTDADIQTIQNEPLCKNLFSKDDFIKKRFMCPNMLLAAVKEKLTNTTDNANDYCNWLSHNCSGAHDCSVAANRNKKSCYKYMILSQSSTGDYGECIISVSDPDLNYEKPVLSSNSDTSLSYSRSCLNYGFSGMIPFPNKICSCDSNVNPVSAVNNKNVCCPTPPEGKYPYYASSSVPCLNCSYGAFNEKSKTCCPDNSYYSSSLGRCVCSEGYTPDNPDNLTVCSISDNTCPPGSHLVADKCISNIPIIKAERFCELVSYYWNVSKHSCQTFTDTEGVSYYQDLYNSITSDNTSFLSAKAVTGAFNNIEPNIVFANGLRMWILGDRSASIPGLSFNPDDFTPSLNICKLKDAPAVDCMTAPDYYCKNDNKCFTINQGLDTLKLRLGDSRNCCSTADFSDLIPKYEGDHYLRDPRTYAINGFTVFIDINGTKDNDEMGGGGTLWKDVFPFYISSNGHVYPAYPLNAAKSGDEESTKDSASLFQGGNSSALSADVFYYGIVDGKRKKVVAYSSIPYARALCFSMEISIYSPYCRNLGSKFRHNEVIDNPQSAPCYNHRCFVKLKNKIKFL